MIYVSAENIRKAQLLLGHMPGMFRKSLSAAINRAAYGARAEAARRPPEKYYIRSSDVRDTITIKKATVENLQAYIKSRGTRRPLTLFKVVPKRIPKKKLKTMLRVGILKDEGLKSIPRAFLNRGTSSGKLHVLQREDSERYPIHIKYGPSVPQMIGHKYVRSLVERRAQEVLDDRLDHEINRILRGYGK